MEYLVVYHDTVTKFKEFETLLDMVNFFQEHPAYIVLRVAKVQE